MSAMDALLLVITHSAAFAAGAISLRFVTIHEAKAIDRKLRANQGDSPR